MESVSMVCDTRRHYSGFEGGGTCNNAGGSVRRRSLFSPCLLATLCLFFLSFGPSHALTIGTPTDKCYKKTVKKKDGVLRDGEFPWFVAVVDEEDALLCSGALVGSRYVITTSLCGENYLATAVVVNYRCNDFDGMAPNCGHAKERIAIAETHFEAALGLLVLDREPTSVTPERAAWPDTGGKYLNAMRKKMPFSFVGGGRTDNIYGPAPVQKQSLIYRGAEKCGKLGFREERRGYLCFSTFCGGPCPGDGGGPIITTNDEGQDVVLGVLTSSPGFLPNGCEAERNEPEGYFVVQAATELILTVTCSSEPKEAWCPEGDLVHRPGLPDPVAVGGDDVGSDEDPSPGPPPPSPPTVEPPSGAVPSSGPGPLDVHNVILDCQGSGVAFQENPAKSSTDAADVFMIRIYQASPMGFADDSTTGRATVDFSYSGRKPVILALQAVKSTEWIIDIGNRPANTHTALQSVLVFGFESQTVQIVDGSLAVNTITAQVFTSPNDSCQYCNLADLNAAVQQVTGGLEYTTSHSCNQATQIQYRNNFAPPSPPTPTPPTPRPPTPTPPTPRPPTPTPPTDPNDDLPIGPSPGRGIPPTPTPPTTTPPPIIGGAIPAPPTPGAFTPTPEDPPLGTSPGTIPETPVPPTPEATPTPGDPPLGVSPGTIPETPGSTPNAAPSPVDPPVGPVPGTLPPGFSGQRDFFLPPAVPVP